MTIRAAIITRNNRRERFDRAAYDREPRRKTLHKRGTHPFWGESGLLTVIEHSRPLARRGFRRRSCPGPPADGASF